MPRLTTLPRLGSAIATVVAIAAAALCTSANAQVGFGPVRPPVTAVGMETTPPVDPLLGQLDLAIEVTSRRYLVANSHTPWQIFHGLLALKRDFQLNVGQNQKISAIQWISTTEPKFDNQPLLLKTAHGGKFHSFTRPYAFEGHPAQFLALLSQSDLPVTHQFKVGTGFITIRDIINNTMKEVNTREEVTWVLWALQHYLPPDSQWVNQQNEPWSIERLVQIETNAAVVGAPCGGNHRLFALTRTRDKHLKGGGTLQGVWAQADHKIRQHVEIARSLQNSDGSFSAKSYETSGITNDLNERLNTTGHTMEFLSIGLPEERLNEQWVRNAVAMLCNELIVNRQREINCGPLYHTLNSLIIYRDRLRSKLSAATQPAQIAATPESRIPLLSTLPGLPKSPPVENTTPALPVTDKGEPRLNIVVPKAPARTPADGLPPLNSSIDVAAKPTTPMPEDKRSKEALNELTLDAATRELLKQNSLLGAGKLPGEVPSNSEARPLQESIQLPPPIGDEPVSALQPANQ